MAHPRQRVKMSSTMEPADQPSTRAELSGSTASSTSVLKDKGTKKSHKNQCIKIKAQENHKNADRGREQIKDNM